MSECKMLVEGRGSVLVFTTEVLGGALVRELQRAPVLCAPTQKEFSKRQSGLIRSDL